MPDRHRGTIARISADDQGTVLVDMMKHGPGTSLFSFELPRDNPGNTIDLFYDLLKAALIHRLPVVVTEHERRIIHVELHTLQL